MIAAITGNIGSGKSTAASLFVDNGFFRIDADSIGHGLYNRKEIKDKVVKEFGSDILTGEEIDRRKLKDIVFYDSRELIKLNKIVHPEIIAEINKIIDEKKGKDIVIEGALIIETKFKNYDKLIVVTIDKAEQIKRLLKKGKYNKDEINNILKSQIAQERKIRYADYIIDNSGSKNGFGKNVKKLIKELK